MISVIAAVGKNGAIGKNNRLLWDIPEDMEHFKKTTLGHAVIMGKKTFLSIGRPLPGRKNIVVTRDRNFKAEGCEVNDSLENVLVAYKNSDEEAFVIGGGVIYGSSLPYADKLYLTVIDDAPRDADTFFPDYSRFKNVIRSELHDNGKQKFEFLELTA